MTAVILTVSAFALGGWYVLFLRLLARDRPHGHLYRYHAAPLERVTASVLAMTQAFRVALIPAMREARRAALALAAAMRHE